MLFNCLLYVIYSVFSIYRQYYAQYSLEKYMYFQSTVANYQSTVESIVALKELFESAVANYKPSLQEYVQSIIYRRI